MGLKNIFSSILTTFLLPNKGADTESDSTMQCSFQAAAEECAVCLSSLINNGEMETKVLPCMHEFHDACVERWLAVPHFKNTCPICRFSMEDHDQDSSNGGFDDDNELSREQECLTEEMVIWFSSFHVAGF